MADAIGPELTGIRLSPFSSFNEATDPETLDLNLYLVDKLSEMGLVYLHAVEPRCVLQPFQKGAASILPQMLKPWTLKLHLVYKLSEMGLVCVHSVDPRCAQRVAHAEHDCARSPQTVVREGLDVGWAGQAGSEGCRMVHRISGASDAVGPVTDSLEPLRKAFKVGTAHATLYIAGTQCHEPEVGGGCHASAGPRYHGGFSACSLPLQRALPSRAAVCGGACWRCRECSWRQEATAGRRA